MVVRDLSHGVAFTALQVAELLRVIDSDGSTVLQ
jgi:hypothetical protein